MTSWFDDKLVEKMIWKVDEKLKKSSESVQEKDLFWKVKKDLASTFEISGIQKWLIDLSKRKREGSLTIIVDLP